MPISLEKGQRISLEKDSESPLTQIVMGLGWDAAKAGHSIDLDASCILFDANRQVVETVYFAHLKTADGSVRHTGDNLTGQGEGDDEQIAVDLLKLPPRVVTLVFTVNSFRGQTFHVVGNAFCRLVNIQTKQEIARFSLNQSGDHTALIMAKLYRHGPQWKMHAIGEPSYGRTVHDVIPTAVQFL